MSKPKIMVGRSKSRRSRRNLHSTSGSQTIQAKSTVSAFDSSKKLSDQQLQNIVVELKTILNNAKLSNSNKIYECESILTRLKDQEFLPNEDGQLVLEAENDKTDIEWEISKGQEVTDMAFLVKIFPAEDITTHELIDLFYEELKDTESREETMSLARSLQTHWLQLIGLNRSGKFEDFETMQQYHQVLSNFLKTIAHITIPFKKRLLLFLGHYVNGLNSTFQFISPENTASVEPEFHNVVESNGSRIKTGLSYLVIRKASKQPVLKADVVTY